MLIVTDFSGGYRDERSTGRMELPTGPREEQNEIPENGPFKAYVGNLPYEVTSPGRVHITSVTGNLPSIRLHCCRQVTTDLLGGFFYDGGCNVADVRLVMDRDTQRPKVNKSNVMSCL